MKCHYIKYKLPKLKKKLSDLTPAISHYAKHNSKLPDDFERTPASSRVTFINTKVKEEQIKLLALGPNFAMKELSKEKKEDTMMAVDQGMERFNHGYRWMNKIRFSGASDSEPKAKHPIPSNNNTKKSPAPLLNTQTETMLKMLKTDIMATYSTCYDKEVKTKPSNIPKTHAKALVELQKDKNIIVKQSDKDKQLVVSSKTEYVDKCMEHLSDKVTYQQLKKNPRPALIGKVEEVAAAWTRKDPDLEKKMNPYHPRIPEFYGTWKTHKKEQPPPIRPVVSQIDSPAENLAHLANAVLSQAINLIPVNITSTEMFMQRMKKCFNNKLTSKHILFTADVKSLYTSIPLKHCLEVTVSFVEKNISQIDMFNLTIKEFEMILSTLLEAGYFRFNELFFKQVKGLAMGSRPAPPLAILYVYLTVEKPLLENDFTYALKHVIRPPDIDVEYWDRYVDDVFGVVEGNEGKVKRLVEYVNKLNPDIQFTYECLDEIPYLDLLVSIDTSNSSPLFNIYYKPTNLGIFINYNSHHPKNIILNTAKNEYKRALKNCSNDELKSAAFKRISYTLLDNDFPKDVIDSILEDVIKQEYAEKETKEKFESKTIISLPYISEQCVRKVKQEVRKRGLQDVVRVVFKPGTTLKQSLVKTKFNPTKCTSRSLETCNLCQQYGRYKYKDCETKSVVYLLECSLCSEIYVGETARPFRERTREHQLSIRNKEEKAFGLHYKVSHKGQAVPSLPFKASLLRSCKDEPDRKLWEAEYIKYKSPSINTQLIKCNKKQFSVDTWAVF